MYAAVIQDEHAIRFLNSEETHTHADYLTERELRKFVRIHAFLHSTSLHNGKTGTLLGADLFPERRSTLRAQINRTRSTDSVSRSVVVFADDPWDDRSVGVSQLVIIAHVHEGTGTESGAVIIAVYEDALAARVVRASSLGAGNLVVLVREDGLILSHHNKSLIGTEFNRPALLDAALENRHSHGMQSAVLDSREYMVMYAREPITGVIMIFIVPDR